MSAPSTLTLRQHRTALSPAAQGFLAGLTEAQRALIAADVEHLSRHPDPAGDSSGLRFSLQLAQRRVA